MWPGYGIVAEHGRHGGSPYSTAQAPSTVSRVFCWMRKMTNSAGLTGAMPIRQISLPLSMSSWVIVVRSHATKNASSAVAPWSAPMPPLSEQEIGHCLAHPGPQRLVVRLEDDPLGGLVDRLLDHDEQAGEPTHTATPSRR